MLKKAWDTIRGLLNLLFIFSTLVLCILIIAERSKAGGVFVFITATISIFIYSFVNENLDKIEIKIFQQNQKQTYHSNFVRVDKAQSAHMAEEFKTAQKPNENKVSFETEEKYQKYVANEPFSFTRLKTFDDCPRKFYYRYIEKKQEGNRSRSAGFGAVVHDAIEHILSKQRGNDSFQLKKDEKIASLIQSLPPEDRNKADIHIKKALSFVSLRKNEKIISIESDEISSLPSSAKFRWIADLVMQNKVNNELTIIDFKTGKTPKELDFSEYQASQILIYGALALQKYKTNRARCIYYYTTGNKKFEIELNQNFSKNVITDVESRISQITKETKFPSNPGSSCYICEYSKECPSARRRRFAA